MLSFIYGVPGCGKNSEIFRRAEADARNGKNVFILVPEQYSMYTEHELLTRLGLEAQNKIQVLTKIVIPSNIPTFFNTLKVNIGLSLVGVISGEFLVSKGGLGYLIVYGGQVFQLDLVMTSVIILAVVAALMYQSIVLLETKFEKYIKVKLQCMGAFSIN